MAYRKNSFSGYPSTLTSWSFSRWSVYNQCPAKAKYKFIDKLQEPGSPAMDRGSSIHKEAENYVLGSGKLVPENLVKHKEFFVEMRDRRSRKPDFVEVETTWAYTKDWGMTAWNDWTGCRLRVKVDLAVRAEEDPEMLAVVDIKTGRYSPDKHQEYKLQLELYALGALLKYPEVREVRPSLLYTDEGRHFAPPEIRSSQKDLTRLKKSWEKRVEPMLSDTLFNPRPGNHCRWCHYRNSNGGPCRY